MNFQQFLIEKRACQDAQNWAKGRTIEQAIDECHRGDWLLWLAEELGVEKRLLVGTAGHCANTVRHLMQDERSRNCVDVCLAYGKGEATDEELTKAAARAAYRAFDADAAADEAAARAADVVADAAAAWAARAARAAAADEAETKNQHQTAEICRKHLKEAMIEKWNQIQKL